MVDKRINLEPVITGKQSEFEEVTSEDIQERVEKSMLTSVHGLAEELADELKTVDRQSLQAEAERLTAQISEASDPTQKADLQVQLIFQYITLISRVQNGGDKGFIPSLAKEVRGFDCSLSVWSLKDHLANLPDIKFSFGYPSGHAVGIVDIADGRKLYVDAQNGFVSEVEIEERFDENAGGTAYPIYEVINSRRLSGNTPNEGNISLTRPDGSDYLPKYFGIREDGVLHTIGNMFMLAFPDSPVFFTESGNKFRESIGIPELDKPLAERLKVFLEEWRNAGENYEVLAEQLNNSFSDGELTTINEYRQKCREIYQRNFQPLVDKVAGGKVIQDTKFQQLSEEDHKEFRKRKKFNGGSNSKQ